MSSDVERWCQNSTVCARRKPEQGLGKSPMQHRPAYRPSHCIAIDIVGPLPMTEKQNEYIT